MRMIFRRLSRGFRTEKSRAEVSKENCDVDLYRLEQCLTVGPNANDRLL